MNTWQNRPRRLRRYGKIALVIAVIVLGYWLLHGSHTASKDKRPQAPIAVAPAARKDMPVYLSAPGTVQAYNTVTVHTQVDGQLIDILFQEGQEVHKGDVLAKIDPRTYQAQFDQATANKARDEATLANARLDLKRYIKLGDSISAQILDTQRSTVHQLEATVKADQAAIDSAQTQLSYTTITSSIDGRTGIRQVDVGNIVHSGDANGLVVLTQLEPISVIYSLPQQNLDAINEQLDGGQKLVVQAMGADNKTILDTGVLELVDNQIDQTTGTIKLKSTFPNGGHRLWPGGFVNVRMQLTTRKDAIVIPTVAVQRGPQNASYVFIYKPDTGTVEMRNVKVAMTEDQETVIDDGVKEGEQVVTDGMTRLQDGSKAALAGAEKDGKDKTGDTSAPAKHTHGSKPSPG